MGIRAAPQAAPLAGIQAATRAAELQLPRPPQKSNTIMETEAIQVHVPFVELDIAVLVVSVAGQVKIKAI